MNQIWLDVPYHEKEAAKILGARWDTAKELWYSPSQSEFDHGLNQWKIESADYDIPGLNRKNSKIRRKRPLKMELVPKTCWYSNVRSNVSKDEWDRIRKEFYTNAGHKCEICDGRGTRHPVELHEVWDYDDDALVQTLENMIALCPACHEVKHMGLAGINGRDDIAKSWLQYVNEWSDEETETHIEECWRLWEERSNFDWTLDISILDRYGVDTKSIMYDRHESNADDPTLTITPISHDTVVLPAKSQTQWPALALQIMKKTFRWLWKIGKFATKALAVFIGALAVMAFVVNRSGRRY